MLSNTTPRHSLGATPQDPSLGDNVVDITLFLDRREAPSNATTGTDAEVVPLPWARVLRRHRLQRSAAPTDPSPATPTAKAVA